MYVCVFTQQQQQQRLSYLFPPSKESISTSSLRLATTSWALLDYSKAMVKMDTPWYIHV